MLLSPNGRYGLCVALKHVAAGAGTTLMLIGVAQAQHNQATPDAPATTAMSPAMADNMPSIVSSAPPLVFASALARYKPMTDQKLGSWREANDTVSRIGGWRVYLKEAQTPDLMDSKAPPAPAAPAPATSPDRPAVPAPESMPPKPNPHEGHGAKK